MADPETATETLEKTYREGHLPESPFNEPYAYLPVDPLSAITEAAVEADPNKTGGVEPPPVEWRPSDSPGVDIELTEADIRNMANAGDKRIRRYRRNLINQDRSISGQLDATWRLRVIAARRRHAN